jgi:hypothetical protein
MQIYLVKNKYYAEKQSVIVLKGDITLELRTFKKILDVIGEFPQFRVDKEYNADRIFAVAREEPGDEQGMIIFGWKDDYDPSDWGHLRCWRPFFKISLTDAILLQCKLKDKVREEARRVPEHRIPAVAIGCG